MEYDPDFHGLVDKKLDLGFKVLKATKSSAVFEINLDAEFVTNEDHTRMGKISATAESKITGFDFSLTDEGNLDIEAMSENLKRVIEGAVFEDIMLHLSTIARFAHFPSLLPIPVIFPRPNKGKKSKKVEQPNTPKSLSKA
jgi:hypothetical protein